jgi:hypothetical protein
VRAGPDRDMRLAEYESIRAHLLSLPCARYPDMDVLKASHPGAPRAARQADRGPRVAVPLRRGHLPRGARRGLPAVPAVAVAYRALTRGGAQGGRGASSRSARQNSATAPARKPGRDPSRGGRRGAGGSVRADQGGCGAMRRVGPRRVTRRRRLTAHGRPRVRRLTRRYVSFFISDVWVNRLTPFFFLF